MAEETQGRKLAAIIAVDIAGYAALAAADADEAQADIEALQNQLEVVAARRGGRIFNTSGDGFMLEFASASEALAAADEIASGSRRGLARVGLHVGDVLTQSDGDLLGHSVNVAARLQALASPGAVLVSMDARRAVRGALASRLRDSGSIDLVDETIQVYALAPERSEPHPLLLVLPLEVATSEPELTHLTDALAEGIELALAKASVVKVLSRKSAFQFRGEPKGDEARRPSHTHVLDGVVRQSGDRIIATLQLMEKRNEIVLWSERYDRPIDQVDALEEDIARAVSGALGPARGPHTKSPDKDEPPPEGKAPQGDESDTDDQEPPATLRVLDARTPSISELDQVSILFATDRALGKRGFGASYAGRLSYGRALVTIPPTHRLGRMESPAALGPLRAAFEPAKHVAVRSVRVFDQGAMMASLATEMAEARSLLLFIHGFNVSFDDAVRRTAQLKYDLRFRGAALLYSWSSRGKLGLRSYVGDRERAHLTVSNLKECILNTILPAKPEKLFVVAHSMGNHALLETLDRLEASVPVFTEIILVAPDVNTRIFMQLASAMKRTGKRTTLYGSKWDYALWASRVFAGDEPRAGDARPPVIVEGVDSIDVSGMAIPNDPINHFCLDDDRVLHDIKEIIDSGLDAAHRMRLRPATSADGAYWRMLRR